MKKFLCVFLTAVMLMAMLPVAFTASADTREEICGAELWVDVPVNGLELNGKDDVEISAAYTSATTLLAYPDPMDNVFKVNSVIWYDTQNPGTALKSGTKAQLGKTYRVSVILDVRDGFVMHPDAKQHPGTKVNGEAADYFDIYTDNSGKQYLLYEKTYKTIAQSSVKPTVVIKEMNLSPYEGNPAEIRVEVTGGTNVRYQWQIVYGDYDSDSDDVGDLSFGGVVNVADNSAYQGCRTNHFKLHTYFGDVFDENDFLKIRCRVTSDNGTVYSQPVWYTLVDREVVSGNIYVTGLDTPQARKLPDKTVSMTSGSNCRVTRVEWVGPYVGNGRYDMMTEGDTFGSGQYRCRIHIATADAYKFGSPTKLFINGSAAAVNTIFGKDQKVYCPDTYYIEKVFTVTASDEVVRTVSLDVVQPKAGMLPKNTATVNGTGYTVADVDWSYYNSQYDEYYIMPSNMTFEKGKTYECDIKVNTTAGYVFPDNMANLTGKINGMTAAVVGNYSKTSAYIRVFFTVPGDGLRGDLNQDGVVDNLDVEYLLWVTLFPEDYTVSQNADFDRNGTLDNQDVEYLLWHTLFPTDYPLSES